MSLGRVPLLTFDARYTQLFDYGMGEGCTGEEDEDNQLVPQIVKKILLPHVIKVGELPVRLPALRVRPWGFCEPRDCGWCLRCCCLLASADLGCPRPSCGRCCVMAGTPSTPCNLPLLEMLRPTCLFMLTPRTRQLPISCRYEAPARYTHGQDIRRLLDSALTPRGCRCGRWSWGG